MSTDPASNLDAVEGRANKALADMPLGRALLREELQPPCYDEVAFFVAFSKTGRVQQARRVLQQRTNAEVPLIRRVAARSLERGIL